MNSKESLAKQRQNAVTYEFDVLFPYDLVISKEQMLTDPHFTSTHFGGEMTIALKE